MTRYVRQMDDGVFDTYLMTWRGSASWTTGWKAGGWWWPGVEEASAVKVYNACHSTRFAPRIKESDKHRR